ncbi:MAG: hypothetical protein IIT70_01385, partial [Clostridia bacterium]|nr:hypothetical protein [Clostridia bacterium]
MAAYPHKEIRARSRRPITKKQGSREYSVFPGSVVFGGSKEEISLPGEAKSAVMPEKYPARRAKPGAAGALLRLFIPVRMRRVYPSSVSSPTRFFCISI